MGIIESVQQYDLTIAPGGAQAIDVAGDRVQFLTATDPFAQIEIRPNFSQGNITLRPGQGFKFSEQVTRWVVFNRGNLPLSGYLMIGSGDFFDRRISGTVDVIDGAKARTLGGIAFSGYAASAAVAAQYSRLQLWNPAGSGKRLVVESVTQMTGSTGANGITMGFNAVALTTAIAFGLCKRSGVADSTAGQLRSDSTAAAAGAFNMMGSSLPASNTYQQKPVEPVLLEPGYGLVMQGASVNIAVSGMFEWYEEPV
ncbi:MAG: hypothetical protein HOQ37_16370 [Cupriavidus sp.]|nr:hypothetical protein [Cupriavidus sp.]